MNLHAIRNLQGAAAVLICLAASGCTHAGDPSTASLEESVAVPNPPASATDAMALAPTRLSHQQAIAHLPGAAGRVTSVRAHDYVNGLRQDILLDGTPTKGTSNSITVLARTSTRSTLDESVPLYAPTESGIRSEIGGRFPHVDMQVVERDSHNAYGTYGLALGRVSGDVRCAYMWQWIDQNRLPQDAGVDGPVSVRIRLCQSGTTFDAMASLFDGLTIGGPVEVQEASADDLHVVSAPDEIGLAPRKRAHRRHPRMAHRDRVVPDDGKVHYAKRSAFPALATPSAVTAPAPLAASLPSDLPAEAYRGPKTSPAQAY